MQNVLDLQSLAIDDSTGGAEFGAQALNSGVSILLCDPEDEYLLS